MNDNDISVGGLVLLHKDRQLDMVDMNMTYNLHHLITKNTWIMEIYKLTTLSIAFRSAISSMFLNVCMYTYIWNIFSMMKW